ncbi:MAG: FHA domain-containing protein [Gaiellaceae bacterium]
MKCGASLFRDEPGQNTMSFTPAGDDVGTGALVDHAIEGRAIIVRGGSGRPDETVALTTERVTIGRSPDCDIFLDDVTVSRLHAVVLDRPDGIWVEDQQSLNGTYVNRERVEESRLSDTDEVRVGRYRLTFVDR